MLTYFVNLCLCWIFSIVFYYCLWLFRDDGSSAKAEHDNSMIVHNGDVGEYIELLQTTLASEVDKFFIDNGEITQAVLPVSDDTDHLAREVIQEVSELWPFVYILELMLYISLFFCCFLSQTSPFLWICCLLLGHLLSILALNAPITTKVVCFSRLLKCLRSLYGKQCVPRSDCSYRSSLFLVHAVCFYTLFVSDVRQLFAADDLSRQHFLMHFFFAL